MDHVNMDPSNDVHFSYAGTLEDLYVLKISTLSWENLTSVVDGDHPVARAWHGFASLGSKIYVHGGQGKDGK